jgi:hypothetical protein
MSGREGDGNRGATLIVLTIVMLGVAGPSAQQSSVSDPANAKFETVSIMQNTSGTTEKGATRFQPKGGLTATNVTLLELIKFAYQRHPFDQREVSGGPAWAASERFDQAERPQAPQ